MTEVQIKHCPFCGNVESDEYAPYLTESREYSQNQHYEVRCDNCGARGGCATLEQSAIESWNMRGGKL